ncbi:hypothetical protein [Streptomyces sp. NPDC060187]|uniref:hypothetical protein n=1 Tax=Streptomyces sp. NPDC060187 TaxID=3347067 RepID=UPI00364618F1
MRELVAALGIIGGITLIALRKRFGRKATIPDNAFGRANAAAGESAVRLGPVIVGSFLLLIGVLAATGVIQVE